MEDILEDLMKHGGGVCEFPPEEQGHPLGTIPIRGGGDAVGGGVANVLTPVRVQLSTEAQHAAILEIDFNLKDYHNKNYRSDQAFRTGAARSFGQQITPTCFPSTLPDREHVAKYLCWQGLSVRGDRADHDFGEELSDEKRKAMRYFWHSEMNNPTMAASTTLFNSPSQEHREAYALIDFDMSSPIPKFISEFHIDQSRKL